jgi:hypothetical protein
MNNIIVLSNGELLTGKVWRKEHPLIKNLPFYSNIPRMDEMAGPLKISLSDEDGHIGCFRSLLVVSFPFIYIYEAISLLLKEHWSGFRRYSPVFRHNFSRYRHTCS